MNFLERYIKRQEQKSAKSSLLQTYLVSLISLCLTVTMLLGTTMAWFTTSVNVPENEIYVGNLKVDFELISPAATVDENGQLQGVSLITEDDKDQPKVFGEEIIWQANHVEVRTFRVTNKGEIPFTYYMSLTAPQKEDSDGTAPALVTMPDPTDPSKTVEAPDPVEFLKLFEVYAKVGDAQGFQVEELFNTSTWIKVGTLDQLLAVPTQDEKSVTVLKDMEIFRERLEPLKASQTTDGESQAPNAIHSIAIKMSEDAVNDIDYGGYRLNFGIKLVANQMGTPEAVVDADKLAALLDQGYSVKISNDIELKKTLNLNGNLLNGQVAEENKLPVLKITDEMTDTPAIITTGGTVRYVKIMGADYKDSKAIVTNGEQVLKQNLYIDHVTIDGVATAIQVEGDDKSKVQVTNSTITGAINCTGVSSVDFVSCTLGNTNFANGSMIVDSNVTFTNCDFTAKEVVKFLLLPENGQRDGAQEKIVVTFDNCTVDGQQVTDKNLLAQLGVGENFSDRYSFVFVNDNAN